MLWTSLSQPYGQACWDLYVCSIWWFQAELCAHVGGLTLFQPCTRALRRNFAPSATHLVHIRACKCLGSSFVPLELIYMFLKGPARRNHVCFGLGSLLRDFMSWDSHPLQMDAEGGSRMPLDPTLLCIQMYCRNEFLVWKKLVRKLDVRLKHCLNVLCIVLFRVYVCALSLTIVVRMGSLPTFKSEIEVGYLVSDWSWVFTEQFSQFSTLQ
jgi:hypothetical protein